MGRILKVLWSVVKSPISSMYFIWWSLSCRCFYPEDELVCSGNTGECCCCADDDDDDDEDYQCADESVDFDGGYFDFDDRELDDVMDIIADESAGLQVSALYSHVDDAAYTCDKGDYNANCIVMVEVNAIVLEIGREDIVEQLENSLLYDEALGACIGKITNTLIDGAGEKTVEVKFLMTITEDGPEYLHVKLPGMHVTPIRLEKV